MAEDNLKDFTVNWVITGLLLTCLITFAITFMFNNNPIGLGDDADYILNQTYTGINTKLLEVDTNANELLNITANTNPEVSQLGSRDSVGSSYGYKSVGTGFWSSMKQLIAWIFVGDVGKMLITVFGGLLGLIGGYFIIKYIRQGS